MEKAPRSREEKEGAPPHRGWQRLPLIPDQKLSLALWAPPAESVDGTVAFCYNYIAMNMEMYRSGRNEADSKSVDGSNRPGVRIPPSPPEPAVVIPLQVFIYASCSSFSGRLNIPFMAFAEASCAE